MIILTVTASFLSTSKTCGKQYTGKTVDKFKVRWNNYKTDARKAASGNIESCKQQFLQNPFSFFLFFLFFSQDDHRGFLEDAKVTLIDKT